jgi:hypothetical protein
VFKWDKVDQEHKQRLLDSQEKFIYTSNEKFTQSTIRYVQLAEKSANTYQVFYLLNDWILSTGSRLSGQSLSIDGKMATG